MLNLNTKQLFLWLLAFILIVAGIYLFLIKLSLAKRAEIGILKQFSQ